jgi:hypothetical protein
VDEPCPSMIMLPCIEMWNRASVTRVQLRRPRPSSRTSVCRRLADDSKPIQCSRSTPAAGCLCRVRLGLFVIRSFNGVSHAPRPFRATVAKTRPHEPTRVDVTSQVFDSMLSVLSLCRGQSDEGSSNSCLTIACAISSLAFA